MSHSGIHREREREIVRNGIIFLNGFLFFVFPPPFSLLLCPLYQQPNRPIMKKKQNKTFPFKMIIKETKNWGTYSDGLGEVRELKPELEFWVGFLLKLKLFGKYGHTVHIPKYPTVLLLLLQRL